jgi:membrane protease YdiL (CAAX protease family)
MKNRSLAAVILLPFVTFGIYTLYWFVSTKGELNAKGANIPTAWLLLVPVVNIFWYYKYFEGAEQVTSGKTNTIMLFLIGLLVTNLISSAIAQDAYNNLVAVAPVQAQPFAPVTPTM